MLSNKRATFAAIVTPLALVSLLITGCTASAPAGLHAVPGDRSATVMFPSNTEFGVAFDWEVRSIPGDHSGFDSSSTPSVSVVVDGLDNGTEYRFVARARGRDGYWSEWSEPSGPVTPRGKPAAPTISRVAGFVDLATGCTARVTFSPGPNGGQPITGYEVTVSEDSAPVRGTSSPIEVPGLTPHQQYDFTVRAINASGAGPASATFTGPCS